jgi:hypothetical protein
MAARHRIGNLLLRRGLLFPGAGRAVGHPQLISRGLASLPGGSAGAGRARRVTSQP